MLHCNFCDKDNTLFPHWRAKLRVSLTHGITISMSWAALLSSTEETFRAMQYKSEQDKASLLKSALVAYSEAHLRQSYQTEHLFEASHALARLMPKEPTHLVRESDQYAYTQTYFLTPIIHCHPPIHLLGEFALFGSLGSAVIRA